MILQERYTLSNDVAIPKLGLGTWMIPNGEVADAVREAVALGYRHVDTASAYANEEGVGEGIRSCGVPRDELFVTTKLAAEVKTYREAVQAIDDSLRRLRLDAIDLMIVHSPQPWPVFGSPDRYFDGNREAWRALENAYEAGKLRAIGVSNFQRVDLDNILEGCAVRPMVNQILAHISNTPLDLIAYSQTLGLLVEAYSPIAHGELMKNDGVRALAAKYGVSVPRLSIRYVLQLGLLPLPKTSNPTHMASNADVDFEISGEDMNVLLSLPQIADYGDASSMPVFGGQRV